MKVFDDHVFCVKDHILIAGFDEGGMVFNLENRATHVVNETALEILRLLDGETSVKDIIHAIAQLFGQGERVVKLDAVIFLKNLVEKDWVYVK